ncbi:MAG: lamin tail domain-containing protein [Flavobacteriales bacterium]|nr:lamin tail domain-containing protein [Flavobacteriales bacterium]
MRFPSFLSLFIATCLLSGPLAAQWPSIRAGCSAELDGDGVVGLSDLLVVLAEFGTTCDSEPPEDGWPQLHITELHYNPASTQGNDSEFEFLEVYNPGAADVDLEGWSLSEGLSFTFPQGANIAGGGYLVVAAMDATYSGLGYPVYDWGSGGLHNSGELIALRSPDGAVMESVQYSDSGDWDSAPDGQGPSLERLFLTGDPHSAAQWSASINTGGTPGAINSLWVD